MGNALKLILSSSIKTLNQGSFQGFCLDFLQVYNERYIGLTRFGGTIDDKTRKGVPDILKTNPDGSQIAVACSVQKNYWLKPKDNTKIESLKPINDINSCISILKCLNEIVLCSPQEIPTNLPNIQSDILTCAKSKTDAIITLFSLPTFEQELISNPNKYKKVIEQYLPDYFTVIFSSDRRAKIILDNFRTFSAPLSTIETLVDKFLNQTSDDKEINKFILESNIKSRFQRTRLPDSGQVIRKAGIGYLDKDISSRIINVYGIPKIGKTTWISQIISKLDISSIDILWYDLPISNEEQNELFYDLLRDFVSKLINNPEKANEVAERKISFDDLNSFFIDSKPKKNIQIIIDITQNLTPEAILRFNEFINNIKKLSIMSFVGILFISNRNLKVYGLHLDKEYIAPSWNEEEIFCLLKENKINVDNISNYCKVLPTICGGHPLIAIAIARKFPLMKDLLDFKLIKLPSISDEDLSDDIKNLLFNDLLKETEIKSFVFKLAPLIFSAKVNLIDFICKEIEPKTTTPVKLMIEKIKGSVLEGSDETGYNISYIYKQILNGFQTKDEQDKILKITSQYLLAPKKGIINIQDAVEGINYAILAGDFKFASLNIIRMIYSINTEAIENKNIEWVLKNLFVFEYLNPKDTDTLLFYQVALLSLSMAYVKIGDNIKTTELLKRIYQNKIDAKNLTNKTPFSLSLFYNSAKIYLVLNLSIQHNIGDAFKIIDELSEDDTSFEIIKDFELIDVFVGLLQQSKKEDFEYFPHKYLLKEIEKGNRHIDNDVLLGSLIECFATLGLKETTDNILTKLHSMIDMDNLKYQPLWSLLKHIAYIQKEFEKEPIKTVEKIDKLLSELQKNNIKSNIFEAKLLQMRGDAYFILKKQKEALNDYKKTIELLSKDNIKFDHAWAEYRRGLCAENISESIESFEKSGKYFKIIGIINYWARSEGSRAIALYRNGNKAETLEIFEKFAKDYYINKQQDLGVATAISIALTHRLTAEITRKELPTDNPLGLIWPEFKMDVFNNAAQEGNPNAGICTAFYGLSEGYKALNNEDKQIECLEIAFSGEITNDSELSGHYMATIGLMRSSVKRKQFGKLKDYLYKTFQDTEMLSLIKDAPKNHDNVIQYLLFNELHKLISDDEYNNQYCPIIIENIKDCLDKIDYKRKSYWLAEVNLRQAEMAVLKNENKNIRNYYIDSYQYAKESYNYVALMNSVQQLGFKYASTFIEMVQYQIIGLKSLYKEKYDESMLSAYGHNLLKFWSNVEYTHISTKEIVYISELRDRAKRLISENIIINVASAVMILALLDVSNSTENPEFDLAKDWAKNQIKNYSCNLTEYR